MNTAQQIIDYTREALRQFRSDPPDSDTQEAYLDALVNFAVEGCGLPVDDEDLAWVTLGPTMPPPTPRQAKRAFQVIEGGKDGTLSNHPSTDFVGSLSTSSLNKSDSP